MRLLKVTGLRTALAKERQPRRMSDAEARCGKTSLSKGVWRCTN
jgi:hypothetical protein